MSVEIVLWFPFVAGVVALIVDVSVIFHGGALTTRILQDASRNLSVSRLRTEADVNAYVKMRLANVSPNATVTTTIAYESVSTPYGSVVTSGLATTTVVVPVSDLDVFGFISSLFAATMVETSQLYIEI